MKGDLSKTNNQQLLDVIFSVSTELLCITDEVGEILKTNPVWEMKLGYLLADLIRQNIINFIHPNDTASLILAIKKLPDKNEILSLSTRMRSHDGNYRMINWQFQWKSGLIFCAGKDLTELYHAKKSTEAADFSRNQLLSILSNEIQEPLENLSLFLELISKTKSATDQGICLENIRLASELLDNLINGMLTTNHNQAGHDVRSFDFHTAVEDAIIPLIASAKRHSISIDLSIDSKLPKQVVGDPQRLKQIVSYLLLTAIKSLERGKISIEATSENTGKSVFKVYFNVKTSGTSALKDITDDPSSINNTNGKAIENSLNFSLELVKMLVETMNGKMSASQGSDGNYVFLFHVLLLREDLKNSKKDNHGISRVLPMYNQNIRLKAEELQAIEHLKSEQDKSSNNSISNSRQRILIVDDAPTNTQLLTQALVEKFEIIVANSGKDALSIIKQSPTPDIILLDLIMPEMSGYEVCKQIKLDKRTRDIPVIFLTTLSDQENEAFDLRSGAVDYISKPFDFPKAEEKIKNHLALKHYREILSKTADTDALTQIPNRRRFMEMLAIEIRKAKRNNTPLSVIRIDIDYFKSFNDTYGHLEGDDCLQEIAFVIKKTLKRAGDLVARWEGEEFACLLPDTNLKGATHVAENIRKAVINLRIPHQTSPIEKFVTLSLGVASVIGAREKSDDISYETLIEQAQAALVQSKKTGRNRIFVYRK